MTEIQYLTADQVDQVMRVIGTATPKAKRDRALFYWMFRYGLRSSEAAGLRLSDVDMDNRRVRIRRLKGSRTAEFPILDDAYRFMAAWIRANTYWADGLARTSSTSTFAFPSRQGGALHRDSVRRWFADYAERAGIPPEKRNPRVLKHSCVMDLLARGVDVVAVQDWVGHKEIGSTMAYVHLSTEHRGDTARIIEGGG